MKILICIGHVPDTTSKIKFIENDTVFNKTDIQYIVGPHEEFALTRLLDLRDAGNNLKITTVTVGNRESENTIRKALAMGADDAIRVDAEPTDAFFVANQIAEVFKKGDFDLILTGKESIDYNGGQVAGMVAELLDLPSINSASFFNLQGDKMLIERESDLGKEVIEGVKPMVISSGKGFAIEPRIPNMRGIMMARKKDLQVVQPSNNEVYTDAQKYYLPQPKGKCKLIPTENAEDLVRLLHEEAKII
jgi:electron transfer flavoprotein beta subunit